MPTLSASRIAALLAPFLDGDLSDKEQLMSQLEAYLDLLLRWNARTNLTAIREPEAMITRHFGESLFSARLLSPRLKPGATILDFGSGAGFPGLPIQLYRPDLQVTLAESQGKKASFLREAIRTLGLTTEVWANRVEAMPPAQQFDCVTLRAVDRMEEALHGAALRISPGGRVAVMAGSGSDEIEKHLNKLLPNGESFPIPTSDRTQLYLYTAPTTP